MSLLSSIWRLIKKIFSAILNWLSDIFGELFLILLIIVLIYFAPVIAAYLASVGAPAFLVTAFEVLAMATPYVVSAVTWLWEGGASLLSAAWSAYSGLSVGTQAAIAIGAAALIAPAETQALLGDAMDVIGTGVSTIAGAVLSSPVGLGLVALGIWWFFLRDKKEEKEVKEEKPVFSLTDFHPEYQPPEEGGMYGKAYGMEG